MIAWLLFLVLVAATVVGLAVLAVRLWRDTGAHSAHGRIPAPAAELDAERWLVQRRQTISQPPAHLFPPLGQLGELRMVTPPPDIPAADDRWPHLARPWADDTGTFPAIIEEMAA